MGKVVSKIGKGLAGAAGGFLTGGPAGAMAGGVGGLLSSGGGGGYFNQQEITPAVRDTALDPQTVALRKKIIDEALTSNRGKLSDTALTNVLSGNEASQGGLGYREYLAGQDEIARLENARAGESIRQGGIAEGIGPGAARQELVDRNQQAMEAGRRATSSRDLFNLVQSERDRQMQAIAQSHGFDTRALDAGQGTLMPRSFAPSGFEQTVAGLGGLYGARAAGGGEGGDLAGEYGYGGGIYGGRGKFTPPIASNRKYGLFGPKRITKIAGPGNLGATPLPISTGTGAFGGLYR